MVATANPAGHYRRDGCLVVNDGGGIIVPQMPDFRALVAGPAEITTFAGTLTVRSTIFPPTTLPAPSCIAGMEIQPE